MIPSPLSFFAVFSCSVGLQIKYFGVNFDEKLTGKIHIRCLVARGFATWKIRHRRFATKKIRHTTGETCKCDREYEHKRRTNVCNSADVEDSPRNDDRLGWGGWVGRVGVKELRLGSGVWGRGG